MIPAPLRSPLGLDENGVITSPVWRIFFAQQLINADQTPDVEIIALDQLLSKGQPTAPDPAEVLSIPAQYPRQAQIADEFPPLTPRAAPFNDLAMASASRFGRQQVPWVISDTRPNRANYPASNYPDGTIYIETDSTLYYYALTGSWLYLGGTYRRLQSQLAALAAGLTADDRNLLAGVTDFNHVLRWTGSAWGFAPGDSGSAYLTLFEVDPGTGWHLYDGATVDYLLSDGTTASAVLPNLAGTAAFLEAGGTNSGPTAAVAPGISGSTGSTAVTVTGTSASGTANIAPVSGNTNNDGGTPQTLLYTAGLVSATVPAEPHTHGFIVAPTDSGHTHGVGSYAGAAHTHGVGTLTVDATGEPRKLVRRPFFRQ